MKIKKKGKTFIAICSIPVLFAALLLLHTFTAGNNAGAYFKWVSGNARDGVVQITTGKTTVVPFEFKVGDNVSEIGLSIRDESLREAGISLEERVIPVRNGAAFSKVIFKIPPEKGIRAGRYFLKIIATDAATRKIIREGEMPYAVDISDLIWKCSC